MFSGIYTRSRLINWPISGRQAIGVAADIDRVVGCYRPALYQPIVPGSPLNGPTISAVIQLP